MLYIDNNGKFYSEEEVENFSKWEIEMMGIHLHEENQEKQLFSFMDDMIV